MGEVQVLKASDVGTIKVKRKRLDEPEILAKYPHAVEGSLRFLDGERKQAVAIECQFPEGCEAENRVVRTSDLFQISMCEAHTAETRSARRKAN